MSRQDKKLSWYREILKSYSRKTIVSVGLVLVLLLGAALFQLYRGATFEWSSIEPIKQPDVMNRLLYSALTFISIGAVLYWLRFYKFLSWVFVSDRRGYREAKRVVWVGLMLLMYLYITPATVDLLNACVSFAYNILLLILYMSPLLFVAAGAIAMSVTFIIYRLKLRHVNV